MEINNKYPSDNREKTGVKESVGSSINFVIKSLLIGVLSLLLMIPLLLVSDLVRTRKSESSNVQYEITQRWGQNQFITTPILIVPYTPLTENERKTNLYILPKSTDVTAQLEIEMRHRSIYDVPVYMAHASIVGEWHTVDIQQAIKEVPGKYDLSRAKISFAISDPTGYQDLVYINVNGEKLRMKSDGVTNLSHYKDNTSYVYASPKEVVKAPAKGVFINSGTQSTTYPLEIEGENRIIKFDLSLDIAGSNDFGFVPTASSSTIKASGNWSAPAFQGGSLPTTYDITDTDFQAQWKSFFEDGYMQPELFSSFADKGSYINLTNPADQYTQTERSIKYGVLVIVLTILSVFLVELSMRRKNGGSINFLHYALSGLSLVLFYSLLLSFSEIIGFGWAYLIAAVMTVVLNTLYFRSVFKEYKKAILLGSIMSILYLAIYLLMQMKEYALLTGSLTLFIILAIVMYFSAKVTK